MSETSSIKKRWAQWSSILLIIIGLAFSISLLPSGYSEDLSVIGSGSNVAVLVHNKEGVRSLNLMNQVDAIRDGYNRRIEFRIAESGTPQGAAFAQKHLAADATLVLFKGDGAHLKNLSNLENAKSLASALNQAFDYIAH